MRHRLIILLVISFGLLASACSRGESEASSMRFRTPSMVYDGMDGGLPPAEKAAYLRNLPSF